MFTNNGQVIAADDVLHQFIGGRFEGSGDFLHFANLGDRLEPSSRTSASTVLSPDGTFTFSGTLVDQAFRTSAGTIFQLSPGEDLIEIVDPAVTTTIELNGQIDLVDSGTLKPGSYQLFDYPSGASFSNTGLRIRSLPPSMTGSLRFVPGQVDVDLFNSIELSQFAVTQGALNQGNLQSLTLSDQDKIVIGAAGIEPTFVTSDSASANEYRIVVTATSGTLSPSTIVFAIETSVESPKAQTMMQLELFNFQTSSWEQIGLRTILNNHGSQNDRLETFQLNGSDLHRFVDADAQMQARATFLNANGSTAFIDLVSWATF